MNWITDNLTKILGTVLTVITTLMTMIASGTFDDLMDPKSIKWLGIMGMLVSTAITSLGFNNSTRERVATAMQDAINAVPGAPLPQNVKDQTIVKPEEST